MTIEEALHEACAAAAITPPKAIQFGKWLRTDTLSGRNGKNDAQVIVNERHVTAMNFQTGETKTVSIRDHRAVQKDRRAVARQIKDEERDKRRRADRAAAASVKLIEAASHTTSAYLARKGFPEEKALCINVEAIRNLAAGLVTIPDGAKSAVVMPARIGNRIVGCQLIFEDGGKRFLFGTAVTGASCRIAKGSGPTWHCEGYATGLTLRTALKSLNRSDTVLCCFAAGNVAAVARNATGRAFILTDNDKSQPQFDGLGTGEHWARQAGKPYFMPPELGDLNDYHQAHGIFAVQKLVTNFLREARM